MKQLAEHSKVNIRKIRQKAINQLKKDSLEQTKDDLIFTKDLIQQITDQYTDIIQENMIQKQDELANE